MKPSLKLLIGIIVFVIASFFIARFFNENAETVQVQFFYWRTREVSKGFFIGFVFLIGVFVTALLSFSTIVSKSFETARLRRENKALRALVEAKGEDKNISENAV
ncbi:MAG: LapA family protein [Deltaproteobacteria bacterium]|nr:LapA family protein [Deltaproteobacteria bacterium]